MSNKVLSKKHTKKKNWELLCSVLTLAEKEKIYIKNRGNKNRDEVYLLDAYSSTKEDDLEIINIVGNNYRIDYIKNDKDNIIYLEYKEEIRSGELLFLQMHAKGYITTGYYKKEEVNNNNLSYRLSINKIKEKGNIPYQSISNLDKRKLYLYEFLDAVSKLQRTKNDLEIKHIRTRK